MLAKRIIPCLDIKNGRTVKGVQFKELRDAGDPVELAKSYVQQGADELVFLDISATLEGRGILVELVEKLAKEINIPFTVGGGINSVDDVQLLLRAGADKVSINSGALKNPDLINALSSQFGSQCIVLAVDAKYYGGKWLVYSSGGTVSTNMELGDWIQEGVDRGVGEILFTSMTNDGSKNGFAYEAIRSISEMVNVPIIASGGAGSVQHFIDVFQKGKADAALAASVFHYGEIKIPELKNELISLNIPVRR